MVHTFTSLFFEKIQKFYSHNFKFLKNRVFQKQLGNDKTDQLNSFTYLGGSISKDGGSSEDVKSRKAKV
jgi:hypothetical protein